MLYRTLKSFIRRDRGAALIAVVLFVALILTTLTLTLTEATARRDLAIFESHRVRALYTAEVGIHAAITRLSASQGSDINGDLKSLEGAAISTNGTSEFNLFPASTNLLDKDNDGFKDFGEATTFALQRLAFQQRPDGSFMVRSRVIDPANPSVLLIRSIGVFGGQIRVVDAAGTPDPAGNLLAGGEGFFAGNLLTGGGSAALDSYNSANGTYEQTKTVQDTSKLIVGSNNGVTLGSNNTVIGVVGSALGPSSITAPAGITVLQTPIPRFPLAPVVFSPPAGATNIGAFAVGSNKTGALGTAGGNANVLVDSVKVQGTLTINGNVNLYVANGGTFGVGAQGKINLAAGATLNLYTSGGEVSINGGGIVNNGRPKDLQLFIGGTGAVTFNGGSVFTGVTYAPEASIKLNGVNTTYGAVVGKDISVIGTFNFHFDESLVNDVQIKTLAGKKYKLTASYELK